MNRGGISSADEEEACVLTVARTELASYRKCEEGGPLSSRADQLSFYVNVSDLLQASQQARRSSHAGAFFLTAATADHKEEEAMLQRECCLQRALIMNVCSGPERDGCATVR